MSLLQGDSNTSRPSPAALYINGIRFKNSAAKFWAGLLLDIRREYLSCGSLELKSTGSGLLDRDILFPAHILERDLEKLAMGLAHEKLEDVLQEILVTGPPGLLRLQLFEQNEPFLSLELPPEVADAETFPYLAGWMLDWAGLPAWQWNNENLSGSLNAEDRESGNTYKINLALTCRHLHEGLHTHTLRIELTSA